MGLVVLRIDYINVDIIRFVDIFVWIDEVESWDMYGKFDISFFYWYW